MKLTIPTALVYLLFDTRVAAQDAFETLDFNATTALILKGVNISSILSLHQGVSLSDRSTDPCAIAVSDLITSTSASTDSFVVHRDPRCLRRNQSVA